MSAERDLLFALLALQEGLATPEQIMSCAGARTTGCPLDVAAHLVGAGFVSETQRDLLEMMIDEQLARLTADEDPTVDALAGRAIEAESDKSEPDTPPDATPETPGRYSFKRNNPDAAEIGRGALGRVVLARDRHLGREVAIKELLPLATHGPDAPTGTQALRLMSSRVARFLREARVTGQLEHPSIVPVYEIGRRVDGSYYYTMRLVRGRTLAAALDECRTLSDRLQLLGHFADLCQAIAYAHSRGVVHRDIKPSNVMVGEFGETVLLDWGLAKVRGQSDERAGELAVELRQWRDDPGQTHLGSAIGTPSYMSPEQAAGDIDRIDERSDIWCLGAVLYRMLTGRPPFCETTPLQTIETVKTATVPPVREVCSEAPADLAAVAEKMLQRRPEDRYGSAREVAGEIRAWQAGGRVEAYTYGSWELISRFVRQNKALSAVALLLLVSLVVGSGLIFREYRHAQAARQLAETNERLVHDQLAGALAEKAEQAFLQHDYLRTRVFSAASLLHNIYNPYSTYRLPSLADMDDPTAALRVAYSHAWWFQAQAHGVLGFAAALTGHTGNVTDAVFSPDGSLLATAGGEGVIRLWDARTHRVRDVLTGHTDSVRSLAMTPDGKLLVSGSRDGTVRVWSLDEQVIVRTLTGHTAEVRQIALSPDGATIASVGRDQQARLWRLADGYELAAWTAHDGVAEAVAFSPDGSHLVTAGRDRLAKIWSLPEARLERTLRGHTDDVIAVAFSPDGGQLATGSWDTTIRLWQRSGSDSVRVFEGHRDGVRFVSFSPQGDLLASAGWDKTMRLWRLARGEMIDTVTGHAEGIFSVRFDPTASQLVTAGADHQAKLWHLHLPASVTRLRGHADRVLSLAFTPDGKRLISSSWDKTVRLWDMPSRRAVVTLTGHTDGVQEAAVSPDGKLLATAGADQRIGLWLLPGGDHLAWLTGHAAGVRSVAFTPDGASVVSGGRDRTVRVWDVAARRLRHTFVEQEDIVWSVAVSPDGRWAASAGFDNTVRLWDLQALAPGPVLKGHNHWVSDVAFSPDGKRLVSSGRDKTIRLWSVTTGQFLQTWSGHEEWVNYIVFSPNGKLVLSASDDRTARIWDATNGELRQMVKLSYEVSSLAFTPDGKRFAVNDQNDVVVYPVDFTYWQRNPREMVAEAEAAAGMKLVGTTLKPSD